jgi:hypothetical protein
LTFARTREGGILTVTAGRFAVITSCSGASRFLTVRPSVWTPGCITILISAILAQQRRHRPRLHRLGRPARLVEVIRQVPSHETKAFYNLGYTVGAYLVFPVQTQVDGKCGSQSTNAAALTLESAIGSTSPWNVSGATI